MMQPTANMVEIRNQNNHNHNNKRNKRSIRTMPNPRTRLSTTSSSPRTQKQKTRTKTKVSASTVEGTVPATATTTATTATANAIAKDDFDVVRKCLLECPDLTRDSPALLAALDGLERGRRNAEQIKSKPAVVPTTAQLEQRTRNRQPLFSSFTDSTGDDIDEPHHRVPSLNSSLVVKDDLDEEIIFQYGVEDDIEDMKREGEADSGTNSGSNLPHHHPPQLQRQLQLQRRNQQPKQTNQQQLSFVARFWKDWGPFFVDNEFALTVIAAILLARAYPPLGSTYLQPDITANWIAVIFIFCMYLGRLNVSFRHTPCLNLFSCPLL